MNRLQPRLSHFLGLFVAFCFLFGGAGISLAQDATPAATGDAHPVHIHEGTCGDLNPAPLFPLNDIVPPASGESSPMAMSGSPILVEMSTTTVDTALADIAGGGYAINAHESAANIGNYIACGDIGGTVVDGTLTIGLHELNDSGYSGIAVLHETDGQTTVTIYLAQGLSGAATSTPAAGAMDHSANASTADTVQVDISNFAYNPDPITIKVGQSVTWTNKDSVAHTVTAKDRDVLQSGTLNEGDSFTQKFTTPGTYEYFCEFHANMKGTVIVE